MLFPSYMSNFQCIAERCEESCCTGGWSVFVDKSTYQKYKNVRDPEWKEAFQQVKRIKPAIEDSKYAKIDTNTECKTCPFLSNNLHCSIQSKFGEDYLSWVCRDYPRAYHIVNNMVEYSATLSCPEISRLALFDPNGISFTQQIENVNTRTTINRDMLLETATDPLRQHYEALRFACISIVQDRRKTLSFRLLFIGKLLQHVQKSWNETSNASIENTIASFLHLWETATTPEITENQSHIQAKLHLYNQIANKMKEYLNLDSFISTWNQAVAGWEENEYETLEKSYLLYMQSHDYVQENYLVHLMFTKMFPFSHSTMWDSYAYLIISHTFLQWLLMGVSASKPLNDAIVTETVYRFERQISHNKKFQDNMLSWIKSEGFDNLAFLTLLTV